MSGRPASKKFLEVYPVLSKMDASICSMQNHLEFVLKSKRRVEAELNILRDYITQIEKLTEDCK